MLLLTVGLLLVGAGMVLDTMIRRRLKNAGEKHVFFRGGTLDYKRYLILSDGSRWSRVPVYVIAPLLLGGIGFIVWGLFNISKK